MCLRYVAEQGLVCIGGLQGLVGLDRTPSTGGHTTVTAPQEHAQRGGRVLAAPQSALYEPRVLDQLNISALIKQLQHGGSELHFGDN